LFLKSDEAKERLKPHLTPGNVHKSMTAAFVAIVAHDLEFYEKIPQLFPHNPEAKNWFNWSEEHAEKNAFRNGSLQGAYLIMAARALGLDCGPMSGFNNEGVDEEFFADTPWRSNFICAMGIGDRSQLHERSPRLSFDEACKLL
jgi:3-hydroxypropanoate dehydrogenase